jgi:5-formyltetrahydrofolate cyclo-ligase
LAGIDRESQATGQKVMMDTSLREQKRLVRSQFRRKVQHMAPATRAQESAALCSRLLENPMWEDTRTVLFFSPLPDEPDIWPALVQVLNHGLTVALPRYHKERRTYGAHLVRNLESDIVLGHHRIREPRQECPEHPLNLLDLVLVPGVAFDLSGHRLGRGAGYYDRLLAEVRGTTCGIAFDEQVSGKLPVEPHDMFVDCLLTPTRCLP